MGRDYYQVLGLPHSASSLEVDRAYHKLALKFHPNRTSLSDQVKLSNFDEVAEAYEVLSNSVLRTQYDLHGADRLKEGFSDGARIHIGAYRYKKTAEAPLYARDVFSSYVLQSNPFANLIDSNAYSDSDKYQQSSMFGYAFGGLRGTDPSPPLDLRVEVPCTLEELYNGCLKEVKYSRQKHNSDRRTTHLNAETKTLVIKPGYANGSELKFAKEGNDGLNAPTSDLIFVIKELPHAVFKRLRNDLACTVAMSLQDCLDCYPVEVSTLDGRVLVLTMPNIGSSLTVPNEGMPLFSSVDPQFSSYGADSRSRRRGNLKIKLDIVMPERIMEQNTDELRELLGS
jgi:DnaJ family protein B protein 13